jgi:TATA-box binding protein (TBP) (component of TFIID and TFIIIB)
MPKQTNGSSSSGGTTKANKRKNAVIPLYSCSTEKIDLARKMAQDLLVQSGEAATTLPRMAPKMNSYNLPRSSIRVPGISPTLYIRNVVATWNMGFAVNLKKIAYLFRRELPAKFNPTRFAAMRVTIGNPPTVVLMFSNGNVVHTGGRTEWHTRSEAWRFCQTLVRIGIPARVHDFRIRNIVSSFHFGHPVNCFELKEKLGIRATFKPREIQCCFIRHPERAKEVELVFLTGGTVITGVKTRDQIENAFKEVYELGESVGHNYGEASKSGYRFSQQREMSSREKLQGVNKRIGKMKTARVLGQVGRAVSTSLAAKLAKKDKAAVPFISFLDTRIQMPNQTPFTPLLLSSK